jgi:hypothetical protein
MIDEAETSGYDFYMEKKPLRIYVDTSVFGGVFDREFAESSKIFFHLGRQRHFAMVISSVVLEEIQKAPKPVQVFFNTFTPILETLPMTDDAYDLRTAYIQAGIVTEKWKADALHIAAATVRACSVVVSWNFKHIVNFRKVGQYNAVNLLQGYSSLSIVSPPEVIGYYEEEKKDI